MSDDQPTTPEPTEPTADVFVEPEPQIVARFKPVNPGDFLATIPQRDLTAVDWDALSPGQRREATAPGPSGKPMYVTVAGAGDDLSAMTRAELNALAAEQGIESPEKLENKDKVIAAIKAADAGGATP